MDHEEFRATSRRMWEAAAPGWAAVRTSFQRDALPVSRWLVDAIHPQPGHAVLELAAGTGETGLLAAELLRPGGKLISTDGAEAMVEVARARAEELGLADVVEAKVMEAEWIDLSAASVDAGLCRWGYMLLADPETALRETRRVLKPGGRLALAVWDRAEDNPWSMGRMVVRLGFAEPQPADRPGPFALGDRDRLEDLLAAAGWIDDVEIDAIDFAFTARDTETWWQQQVDCSITLRDLTARLSPAEHYRLRDAVDAELEPYTQPDGSLRVPARTLVAAASA